MQELIHQFMGHEAGPLVQFLKYAIAGAIATGVHIGAFHAFAWSLFPALTERDHLARFLKATPATVDRKRRGRNSMIANALAFLISNLVCYFINIAWVFEAGRYAWFTELALFYAVSGISVVLGTLLMGWLIRRFGMLTTYAFAANLMSSLLINYAMRKFVIFSG